MNKSLGSPTRSFQNKLSPNTILAAAHMSRDVFAQLQMSLGGRNLITFSMHRNGNLGNVIKELIKSLFLCLMAMENGLPCTLMAKMSAS